MDAWHIFREIKTNLMIEACTTSIESALQAQKGGAKRVELCDNIYEGGTTPGYGTIKKVREVLDIDLNVMIRPRGQDFCYSEMEFEIMKEDIQMCKQLGADGVVLGILKPDGNIDLERTTELVNLARPMSVTFHRAFDMTPDPFKSLEDIISAGADRILTSGHQNKAYDGIELIRELVIKAGDRIIIMPGSGINEENILEIKSRTGAKEFHLSGSGFVYSRMQYRKEGIFMGGMPGIPEYEIRVTDANRIRKMVDIIGE